MFGSIVTLGCGGGKGGALNEGGIAVSEVSVPVIQDSIADDEYDLAANELGDLSVRAKSSDILLIHGFNLSGGGETSTLSGILSLFTGTSCEDTWENQADVLRNRFPGRNVVSIGYYGGEDNCDVILPGSEDNSVSTPIEEIAFELYQFIYNNYTVRSKSVDIVAHSMGGIIARKMLADWGNGVSVSRVVTLGTPHGGHRWSVASIGCPTDTGTLTQCYQLAAESAFMEALPHNPQSAIGTQWTLISSDVDGVVGGPLFDTGTAMHNGYDALAPIVKKVTYLASHLAVGKYTFLGQPILHGTLVGESATMDFYKLPMLDSVDNPTKLVVDALRVDAAE